MHVVLVAPEIAPNTGSIIRLCANTGATLHLVEPLGFSLDSRSLKRGGLDYHELADVRVHADLERVAQSLTGRWFAFSSGGNRSYDAVEFRTDDVLVFGAERAGLSDDVLARFPADHVLTIPMRPGNRSLNLSNAVAIVVYEAWRQAGFTGADVLGSGRALDSAKQTRGLTSEASAADSFDS